MEPPEYTCEVPIFQERSERCLFQKMFPKITEMMENFLETLAEKDAEYHRKALKNYFLCPAVLLTSIAFMQGVWETGRDDENNIVVVMTTRVLPVFPIEVCILFLALKPFRHFEYRKHLTDIGSRGKKSIVWFNISIMLYFIIVMSTGFTIWDVFTLFGLFVIEILCILIALLNAQIATKLRINPCSANDRYTLTRTEIKDKGTVQIVESSVFKVTLRNIGSEPWNSTNFVLHRHLSITSELRGRCFRTILPVFIILPQQSIDLVPESHEFDGECIRFPQLHCFGESDRLNVVKTVLMEDNGNYNFPSVDNDIRGFCSGKKIAEHISNYKFTPKKDAIPKKKLDDNSEWTNIAVF